MDHHPAGLQQAVAFAHDRRHRLAAGFVQQDMADDQIEAGIREARGFGIALQEAHLQPQPGGAGMGIAQLRPGDIDADHLGVRKRLLEGQGGVANGAAHVEDAGWPEIRHGAADIIGDGPAHVVVGGAHIAHGIKIDAAIIERAGCHTAGLGIAAGHAVDVNRRHIARGGEIIMHLQRRAAGGGERGGAGLDLGQLPFDRVDHSVPDAFLGDAVGGGIGLEIGIGHHRLADVVAVGRGTAGLALEAFGGAGGIDRAQAGQQAGLHEALQAFGEFLPGAFVMIGLGQHIMVTLLECVEHRVHDRHSFGCRLACPPGPVQRCAATIHWVERCGKRAIGAGCGA